MAEDLTYEQLDERLDGILKAVTPDPLAPVMEAIAKGRALAERQAHAGGRSELAAQVHIEACRILGWDRVGTATPEQLARAKMQVYRSAGGDLLRRVVAADRVAAARNRARR
jgi:hypothetical protein